MLIKERTQNIQCTREETIELHQVNWQTFSHTRVNLDKSEIRIRADESRETL
jgi:hypothetical protein